MKCSIKLLLISLLCVAVNAVASATDISPEARTVTQNFDAMYDGAAATLSLPADWRVDRNLSAPRTVGAYSSAATEVMYEGGISLASNAKNGTWNWGASSDVTDRCVGGLSTTVSGGTRCVSVMTKLHNAGEVAISKLSVNYDIEKYRYGANAEGFVVQLYTSTDGSTWSSAGDEFRTAFAADASTIGAEVVPISTTAVSDKTLKVNVNAGADLYLAWNITVAAGTSPDKAMGLAIDNVSIEASFENESSVCYVYAEDVTKWGALLLNGAAATGTTVVNGVTYKYYEIDKDGSSVALTFSDGASNQVAGPTITADKDYYYCVTADEVTAISDPTTYTGWVDPDRKPFVASGIYLRGEVTSWNAIDEWQFSDEGNGVYVLYDKTLTGNFKVADASWSSACNYGSNGTAITMGAPYSLVSGTNDNISCGTGSFVCARIVLTIVNGNATLLLEPNEDATGLTSVYVMGDNNGWNYMDASGELALTETPGVFSGQVTFLQGTDGYSHWMIYQRLGMAGAWGAGDADLTGNNTAGTLVKGTTTTVSTAPGTYVVTFNIVTGEYSLTQIESQPVDLIVKPATALLVPTLPKQVKVLSLNNSLIYYNDQDAVFNGIASAMGKDAVWTKHTLLGKSLNTHWQEGDGMAEDGTPGAKMLVRSQPWSHIILQEQSSLPRTDIETFRTNVKRWRDYIREYCPNPNAVIIVPVNWAYSGDWSSYTTFNTTFITNYLDVASDLGVTLCPVGLAYQDVYDREGSEGTQTWFLDDRHPTLKATYMAACMEYSTIFGVDANTINWAPADLSSSDAEAMRGYASRAMAALATNPVVHTAGTVRVSATLVDQFGMPLNSEINANVSGGGTLDDNLVFTSDGTEGEFTVTVTSGSFTGTSVITVAAPVTTMVVYPAIELSSAKLSHSENFDAMGDGGETGVAAMPTAWRIDRQVANPRVLGRYDQADDNTMYSGGVNLPSNAKNGTWNFGNTAGTDRAVGGITTGVANATRCVNVYAHLLNVDARKPIQDIVVSYDVEKYRKGSNAAGFDVQLYYSIDGRNWTSAGSDFLTHFEPDSETAGYADVPGETAEVSAVLPTTMAAGCDLYLAWNITLAANSGSANAAMALGIDNFKIEGALPPIPTAAHYIYVEDKTGWDALGLYAYGDSELLGAWPGESWVEEVTVGGSQAIGQRKVAGITLKKFLFDTESGNYNLIFNNWNNGKQTPDYPVNGTQDYYLTVTETTVTPIDPDLLSGIDALTEDGASIAFDGAQVSAAGSITVIDLAGRVVRVGTDRVAISDLPVGAYVVTAPGHKALKVIK